MVKEQGTGVALNSVKIFYNKSLLPNSLMVLKITTLLVLI
jgi:hypothetical protein